MSVTTISSMFEVLYECMADKKARAPRPRDRWLEVDPRRFLMYPLGSIFHCEPMPQHQRRLVDVLVEHVTQSGGELYAASVQSYLVLKHSDLYYRAVEPVMGFLPRAHFRCRSLPGAWSAFLIKHRDAFNLRMDTTSRKADQLIIHVWPETADEDQH